MNEDIDDWLYKIRINLDIASIPELRYLDFITNYCISKAGIFLRRLRESHENKDEVLTWAKFKTAMITRYRPVDHSRRIRNQLMTLKQTGKYNDYVDTFQNLCNQIDTNELSEKEKLHYFIEGLQKEAKFQIISRKIKDIDDAILIAAELESCNSKHESVFQATHKQAYNAKFKKNNFS